MDDGGEVEHSGGAGPLPCPEQERVLVVFLGHGLGGVGYYEHEDGSFEGDKCNRNAFRLRRVHRALHPHLSKIFIIIILLPIITLPIPNSSTITLT